MKVLSVLMLFVLLGVQASAQQEARVIAEVAAGNEKMVKNSPFSAEAISESVQTLADGNRIVRTSSSKLYRNSEGRFRREMAGGSGGMFATDFGFGQGISIVDPVVGHRVMLDRENMTARIAQIRDGQNIAIGGHAATLTTKALTDAKRAELEAKLSSGNMTAEQKEKLRRQLAEAKTYAEVPSASGGSTTAVLAPSAAAPVTVVAQGEGNAHSMVYTTGQPKYETRTEDLGTRDFEGVSATGTRRVTTIPAGAIGNERPIETVYERWYSKELEMVVYSKRSDPRVGEQTYRLTNINRSEPDPSLFTVPPGYRTLNEPPPVYRISPAVPARTAVSPRTPVAPRAVTVSNTKP